MPELWDAEVEIDLSIAGQLVRDQFPTFSGKEMTLLGQGWDNLAILAGDHVFRFPRRKMGADLLDTELEFLPHLVGHLLLPITAPTIVGNPAGSYPYKFAGYPQILGVTACRSQFSFDQRSRLAVPIARFISQLHKVPTSIFKKEPPGDLIARADTKNRRPRILERLQKLPENTTTARKWIEKFEPTHAVQKTCVHGDLYARHLLIDSRRNLAGVIDWGDFHLGDPALDLSIAFSFLPSSARSQFRKIYGEIDDKTWERARFRALSYASILIPYGRDVKDSHIEQVGLDALKLATSDD